MVRLIKGFTLIELLVVLAIMAIISLISTTAFISMNKHQAVKADAELVLSVLTRARNDTLSSKNDSKYGVHFGGQTMIIFAGTTYSSGASTNITFDLNPRVSLAAVITGGGSDIIFERLTGKTFDPATITLSTPGATSKVITVYATGIAQLQ